MAKFSYQELLTKLNNIVTAAKISNSSFVVTRDNTVELLDKVGKIGTLDTVFTLDKLADFDGEYLSFGKTIEDWYEDLILPSDYDSTGANALAPNDPTYRPVYYSYTVGKKVIKTTIRNNDIERAVHNTGEMITIVAMKTKRMADSMAQYRYGLKREMIARFIDLCESEMDSTNTTFNAATSYATINTLLKDNNTPTAFGILVKKYTANDASNWADAVAKGFIIVLDLITEIAAPTDTTTSNAFIKQIKKDVEVADDLSEGHSLNGNTIGAVEGITLIVKQGVIPNLEVESFAGAFNREDLAVPAKLVVVKDFGTASDDYYAILMDSRAMRLHNTYRAMRDNSNGEGDFLNLFNHTEDTAYLCRNAFVKCYKKP